MRVIVPVRFYTFGPFRVDVVKRLLLRDGAVVPLTPKAFDTLVLLLQRRGSIVEKDELLREIWRGAIVEENNLARNISTLRKALDDAPGLNRCIVTIPGRGYQFTGDVAESSGEPGTAAGAAESNTADASPPSLRQPSAAVPVRTMKSIVPPPAIAVALVVLATAAVVYAIRGYSGDASSGTTAPHQIWQLTFAPGLQGEPSWSPDGRMVAFSSDRSGNLDIWVQGIDSGNPVQVTQSPAHDWQPHWSADGRLAFRSEREGGGIYVVPALGGAEQQVATFGYHPQWSPDGRQVLFHRSNFQGRVLASREMYTVSLDGRPPRQILSGFLAQFGFFSSAWHPDSKRVSVWGVHLREGLTFWTATLDGAPPVKSDIAEDVRERFAAAAVRFTDADHVPLPFLWSPSADALYFEGLARGVRNLWKVRIDRGTLQWRAGPQRLTTSADLNEGISLSADGKKLALSVRNERIRLWSFRMDTATGQLLDAGEPITAATVDALSPVLSRDGTQLVYETERGGSEELWRRSLADGRETLLVAGDGYRRVSPVWSHDDRRIMYLRTKRGEDAVRSVSEVVTIPASGGAEQALPTPAPVARLFDWSADGTWILAAMQRQSERGYELALVRADGRAAADVRVLAADPHSNLWKARLSADQKWIAFAGVTGPGVAAIYAVPVTGGERVHVTTGEFFDDRPRWSPEGRVIYFLSNRSGFLNVWGQRFDPEQRQTVGEPFPVTRFDSPARMIPPRMVQVGVALARDRIILPVSEASGNIWILDGVDR